MPLDRPVIPVKIFLSHQSDLISDYTHFSCRVNSLSLSREKDDESEAYSQEDPDQQVPSYFDAKQVRLRKNVNKDSSPRDEVSTDSDEDEISSHQFEYSRQITKLPSEEESYFVDLINDGFSVILYGFGCKRMILDNLQKKFTHFLTVCIHGYFAELTTKNILAQLKDLVDSPTLDPAALYQAVQDSKYDHLLIVIHSLDRLILNNGKIKDLLVLLASLEKVQILASVDHVNSQLLFTNKDANDLRLMWAEVSTFNSYQVERMYSVYGTMGDFKNREMLTISAVSHVYDSLTTNAQRIFGIILRYYLDKAAEKQAEKLARQERLKKRRERNRRKKRRKKDENSEEENELDEEEEDDPENGPSEGVVLSFSALYRMCREEYMVNSDTALKTLLGEFEDHDIIKMSKSSDGSAIIRLRISLEVSKAFLDKIEE